MSLLEKAQKKIELKRKKQEELDTFAKILQEKSVEKLIKIMSDEHIKELNTTIKYDNKPLSVSFEILDDNSLCVDIYDLEYSNKPKYRISHISCDFVDNKWDVRYYWINENNSLPVEKIYEIIKKAVVGDDKC